MSVSGERVWLLLTSPLRRFCTEYFRRLRAEDKSARSGPSEDQAGQEEDYKGLMLRSYIGEGEVADARTTGI